MNVAGGPASTQQGVFGIADGNHAGEGGKALLQSAVKLLRLLVSVTSEVGIYAEQQDILRVEAGIDAVKIVQRSYEKPCSDEDDDGKSDLRDDK